MGRSTLPNLAGVVRRGLLASLGLVLVSGPSRAMPRGFGSLRAPQVYVNGTGLQAYFAGVNSGSMWMAWDDDDAPAGGDFDDCIVLAETGSEGPFFTVTQRTTWGALKARFR